MPALRVKCRCGQEVVLRFSEWVYALFGLLVLGLLINGTALVVIVIHLGSMGQGPDGRRERPAEPAIGSPGGVKKAGALGPMGGEEATAQGPALGPPPDPSVEGRPAGDGKAAAQDGPKAPAPQESVPADPRPSAASPSPAPGAISLGLLAGADPRKDQRPDAGGSDVPAFPAASRVSPARASGRPAARLFSDAVTPLERLLTLEKCQDPKILLAFLQDEDALVRREALRKFLAQPDPAGPRPLKDLLAIALPAAPGILDQAEGADLLRRLSGEDLGREARAWRDWGSRALDADPDRGVPEAVWSALSARAQVSRDTCSAAKALEGMLRPPGTGEPPGVDILLAIDTSESMEEPLAALGRRGEWLFPALAWALPGLRCALLTYEDEVGRTAGLGTDPAAISRILGELKASGGGDVPEGVFEALKAALQLGRFEWRPDALKQIVFVGDGPPRRPEVQQLLSLARECHNEGGFRIHAISVNPSEGRKAILRFPELAEAGGGVAVTAAGERIAEEIFFALLPRDARAEVEKILPLVQAAGLMPGEGGGSKATQAPAGAARPPWKTRS